MILEIIKYQWKDFKHTFNPNFEEGDVPKAQKINLAYCFICFILALKVICVISRAIGVGYICDAEIHHCDLNHLYTMFIQAPVTWMVEMYLVRQIFKLPKNQPAPKYHRFFRFICEFVVAYRQFGWGAHYVANFLEMYATNIQANSGKLYDAIFFWDEIFTHQQIIFSGFIYQMLFTIHDRKDRVVSPKLAILTVAGQSASQGASLIEGHSWFYIFIMPISFITVGLYRAYKYKYNVQQAWNDFFFRHTFCVGLMFPLIYILFFIFYGGLVEPSRMHGEKYKNKVPFVLFIVFCVVLFIMILLITDCLIKKYFKKRKIVEVNMEQLEEQEQNQVEIQQQLQENYESVQTKLQLWYVVSIKLAAKFNKQNQIKLDNIKYNKEENRLQKFSQLNETTIREVLTNEVMNKLKDQLE